MSKTIELTATDGQRFDAHVAEPPGTSRGALVVVQEIFGVNAHMRSVAEGFAAEGYLAIAPALFDRVERGVALGYGETDIQRGFGLKTATGNGWPLLDIEAAVAHVARAGKVGVIGYCWGGLLSWLAACTMDGLAASVPYYGGGIPGHATLVPRCPVMAHFGAQDNHIPLDSVKAFGVAQPGVTIHVYPAHHGFNCDERGSFDAPSAALARERTVAFLRQHLG